MPRSLSPFHEINQVCTTLFDIWCQRRNVIALCYLMSAWPVLEDHPVLMHRVLTSLGDLRTYHIDSLIDGEAEMIDRLLGETCVDVSRCGAASFEDSGRAAVR